MKKTRKKRSRGSIDHKSLIGKLRQLEDRNSFLKERADWLAAEWEKTKGDKTKGVLINGFADKLEGMFNFYIKKNQFDGSEHTGKNDFNYLKASDSLLFYLAKWNALKWREE